MFDYSWLCGYAVLCGSLLLWPLILGVLLLDFCWCLSFSESAWAFGGWCCWITFGLLSVFMILIDFGLLIDFLCILIYFGVFVYGFVLI